MNTRAIRFYTRLAAHYDELFPADPDVLLFLQRAGASPGASVRVMDMGELDLYDRHDLDLVFCIGNSIAHLGEWTALRRLLRRIHESCRLPPYRSRLSPLIAAPSSGCRSTRAITRK